MAIADSVSAGHVEKLSSSLAPIVGQRRISLGLMETMIRAHCDLHISAFNIGECSLYI